MRSSLAEPADQPNSTVKTKENEHTRYDTHTVCLDPHDAACSVFLAVCVASFAFANLQ